MGTWNNADGLFVKLGSTEATASTTGEYRSLGPLRVYEGKITLANLTTTPGSGNILEDFDDFPKCRIEQVDVEVETAATSGGSATLDVGFIKADRSTELDYNGLVAAAAKATIDTAGKKLTLINGATAAGALIGTTTTDLGLLVANANTAVFTAGVVRVRVYFYFV